MLKRYTIDEMGRLFANPWETCLEVELAGVKGQAEFGEIPAADAELLIKCAPQITESVVKAIDDREAIIDHDMAAFVDVIQEWIGDPVARWFHHGMTSADITDTALCLTLTRAADLIMKVGQELLESLYERAVEHRDTMQVGRTHEQHAEPITFGAKVALWYLQLARDLERLAAAREGIAVGKLSGAVGTYSNIDPMVERVGCDVLGLKPVAANQIIARDRHAALMAANAQIGGTIELIATQIMLLQHTEIGEVQEPFKKEQKGSSAMPHKKNPVKAEQLTGLSRLLRGYMSAAFETIVTWHERDISNSAPERVYLADSCILTHYMLVRMKRIIDGLVVNVERMSQNLDISLGLIYSQSVMLAMVDGGMARDDAYRIVQRVCGEAWAKQASFRFLIEADPEVTLSASQMSRAFDLQRVVGKVEVMFDRLRELHATANT